MVIFLSILHVLACLFLIFVILLQAGRGGGLSEMFGGGDQAQKMFGTQTNVFLVRLTTGAATLFILTSVTLALLHAQRGKSLLRDVVAPLEQKTRPIRSPVAEETAADETTEPTVEEPPAPAPAPAPDEAQDEAGKIPAP